MKMIGRWRPSPFAYSTDTWYPETVNTLDSLVAKQTTPKERSAGFVLGGGKLLYLLGHVDVGTMYMDDLFQSVLDATQRSVDIFKQSDNWGDYRVGVLEGLKGRDERYFNLEWSNVCSSGLITNSNFATVQERVHNTSIVGFAGDIRQVAPDIAREMVKRRQQVIVANLVNVAEHMDNGHFWQTRYDRMELLGESIGVLPLSEEVVIADSTESGWCIANIYTKSTYPGMAEDAA